MIHPSHTPLVSVIIPTHNRPDLVVRSVRSVLNQTYTNLEVIVVDVGTKERAKVSLSEFESDSRFRYVENQTELLGGAARNLGVSLSLGEYVAFQDDDDAWFPEKLEIQMKAILKAQAIVGFAFSAVQMDYGNERQVITEVYEGIKDYSEEALRRMNGFLTVTLVIKKTIFDAVGGFDEKLPSHQDPELIIRVTRVTQGVGVNIPLVLVNASSNREHVGRSLQRRLEGREMVIAKHKTEFLKRPKVLASHYFTMGLWARDNKQFAYSAELFFCALVTSFSLRYAIHWCYARFLSFSMIAGRTS